MNYGAIGFVIGHEITHGFDDQGRQFDKNGNLVDWWAPQTKEKYLEKAECIIHQYGNYTVEEVNLNVMIDFYYTHILSFYFNQINYLKNNIYKINNYTKNHFLFPITVKWYQYPRREYCRQWWNKRSLSSVSRMGKA